ncbi:MAG: hypothetical protein JWP91_1491 [Fibrobacteres bacterium]|nr:hypothetical protein [Fibrobacterota bacterium]
MIPKIRKAASMAASLAPSLFLAAALGSGLPAHAASSTTDPVVKAITYAINPSKADAGKDFELDLLSYGFNCGTSFDNLAVNAAGNVLTLSFLDHEKPGVICPAIYKPYGPAFKVAGLKAGAYQVKAYRLPACYPCKMAGETSEAGTLTVGPATERTGWFLKEGTAYAGKPFSLQLLNEKLGNCGTSFSHKSISAQQGAIYASFLVEDDPNIVCIADIHPYGPAFDMQALKAGAYPVYVTEMLPCQVTAPICAVKLMPILSDTLIVAQSLSVLASDLRANGLRIELNGSRAAMLLPAGIGGTWKAELLTLNGRRLAAGSAIALGGERAEFDLGLKPERGIYLLRVSAPDGETHMLPIIRKD